MGSKFRLFKKKREIELGIVDENTPFAIREAYKALYTNIVYLNADSKCKKIAVTSAVSGEGKTCLSANLAVTLAQNLEGKRVLLIDADMRRPSVSRMFAFRGETHGLSEYLAGIDDDPHFDYVSKYKLMVLNAGGTSFNPTKLIGSERMKRLIKACESEFDYVIIDTPPINVVADAVLLNGIVDGYIISTRSEYSNIHAVSQCIEKLQHVEADIYGIVLSDLKLKGYFGKYNRYNRYNKKYSKYEGEYGD